MPPPYYTLVQRKARLTSAETGALIQGLARTVGDRENGSGKEKREEEEHERGERRRD